MYGWSEEFAIPINQYTSGRVFVGSNLNIRIHKKDFIITARHE